MTETAGAVFVEQFKVKNRLRPNKRLEILWLDLNAMLCSVIIPTIGRATLARAVKSVLDQSLEDDQYELIIVNDGMEPISPTIRHSQPHPAIRFASSHQQERSVARNMGAKIARGRYLHFLDDDDWLLPDALANLAQLARQSDAEWIYGHTQLVNRNGVQLLTLRHALIGNQFATFMAGEWLPLQSSWIRSDVFWQIEGFRMPPAEDVDLTRRLALHWPVLGITHSVSTVEMGQQGSTTDLELARKISLNLRELILNDPLCWDRLWDSAETPSLKGRIVRFYVTSAIWNLRNREFGKAGVRCATALRALLRTIREFHHAQLWRSIYSPYSSPTFTNATTHSDNSTTA